MFAMVREYFGTFVDRFGRGWNRFWYTPSDPYALGLLRLTTGLVLLYLHATFTCDLVRFFGPHGLLSGDVVVDLGTQGAISARYLSHLFYLQTPAELYTAHALAGVVLLLFTVGFRSRITTVLALLVTLTYIHRGPMLTSQIEPIVAMLLLYLCVGPSGASFSVDRWLLRRKARRDPAAAEKLAESPRSTSATISIRLIQVHLTVVYLMMGLAKIAGPPTISGLGVDGEWFNPWGSGEAVWWLMARPESRMVDLTWMAMVPVLLYVIHAWSHAIVLLEIGFALFIWNRLARPLMLGLAGIHWTLFALISGVPVLSAVMLAANLAFFSPEFLRVCCRKTAAETP